MHIIIRTVKELSSGRAEHIPPLWELWCGSVSGFCYQKGSPLDIESIFRVGERCLHTDEHTLAYAP